MKIDNLNVNHTYFNDNNKGLKLNKSFIAISSAIFLSLGIGTALANNNNQINTPNKTLDYYEQHQEEFPLLKIKIDNPIAIQQENAKLLLTNQDDLLLEYIKIYPDGYIDIDETYLYPKDECRITLNINDENIDYSFKVDEDVNSEDEYLLTIDCLTKEIKVEKKDNTKEIPHL